MLSNTIGPDFSDPQPLRILHQNFKPCDLLIDEPEPTPLPEKLANRAIAKAKLKQIDTERRQYAAFILEQYGPTGKPAGSYAPPDGDWTSSKPNQFLTLDCALSLDPDQLDLAEAAVDGWRGVRPWKNCVSPCGQYVWIQNEGTFAQWVPLRDRAAFADSKGVQTPETVAWTPYPADVKWTVAATGRKPLSPKELNDAFESYMTPLTGVDTQTGNLQIALYLFAEARRHQCEFFMKDKSVDLQADDIISGFAADLIHRLGQGQYAKHEGNFHRWLFKKWGLYFAGIKTDLHSEANMTQRVEDAPEDDDERLPGAVYLEDLGYRIGQGPSAVIQKSSGKRQGRSEVKVGNDPVERVKRILCDLDNPETAFGKINGDMKRAIRAMAKGLTQEKAAHEVGLSVGHMRKKLKALAPIGEQTFIGRAPTEGEQARKRWQDHQTLTGGAQ